MRRLLAAILVLASAATTGAQFAYRIQSPLGADSFRTAVEAYGRGRYAESLAQFERALAESPNDPLSLYWLGKSYYRLGLSGTAFARWNDALAAAGSSPFLESRLELAGALADPRGQADPERYVRVSELNGKNGRVDLFKRPSWIEPMPDGSCIVVSHGTDALLVVDANARIQRTINAGSSGFDRPFAVVVLDDGTMFVSEFQADRLARLAPDGRVLGYSGDASGPGRLSGPQYLAADADGFVYVGDVGFSRVVKFSRDGAMLLSFGGRVAGFDGLKLPTGIAVIGDRVYVADVILKAIFSFDRYGNHVGRVLTARLERPEGLRATEDGKLLLADGSRVMLIDPASGSATELYRSERKKANIVSAAFDANGDLIVADFDASELAYLSDPASRFAGLSVDVGRVYSDAFPLVRLDLTVKDRHGRPVSGLGTANFYLSESVVRKEPRVEGDIPVEYLATSINPAAGFAFEGTLDRSSRIDMTFLFEASPETATLKLDARDAVASVYESLGSDASARLAVAGRTAQPVVGGSIKSLSNAILEADVSGAWRFDSGLRLAAGSLFAASGRRALVYIGSGSINEGFLDGASIAELSSMLLNNDIALYAVILGKSKASEALAYLAERTGGVVYRADRPEGLGVISQRIRKANTGTYRLSYQATADDYFGKAYLPFGVEVYLRDRSGKDETGYFAPLR
jgi:DNA-binding beta-propeller fold protein YncE